MNYKKEQREKTMDEDRDYFNSNLMRHIQEHVYEAFMEWNIDENDFVMNSEEAVHYAFSTNVYLGGQVVSDYLYNMPGYGMSMTDVNEVLEKYNEYAREFDLDTEDNIGSMVNVIMFNIANRLLNLLELE